MKKCFFFFLNEKKCIFNMFAVCRLQKSLPSMNNIGHKVHVKIYMDHQIMDQSEIQSFVAQDNIRLGRTTNLQDHLKSSDQIRSKGLPHFPRIKPKRKSISCKKTVLWCLGWVLK